MGTPLPPEPGLPPDGVLCPTCWGAGKAFGDVPTPEYVFCKFAGLVPCDPEIGDCMLPPNDVIFRLDQWDIHPCQFRHLRDPADEPGWTITLRFDNGTINLSGWSPVCGGTYFFDDIADCSTHFTNQAVCGMPAIRCSGGEADIWWT